VTTKWLESMDDVLLGVNEGVQEASAEPPTAVVHAALMRALEGDVKATLVIDGRSWDLGRGVLQFVQDSVDTLGQGLRVSYVAEDSLLSPEDVAGLLGVSRPFVYKLLDSGELPVAVQNGTHRKVAASSAVAWRELQHGRAAEADRVAALAEHEPTRTRAERRAALRDAVRSGHSSGNTTELETEAVLGRQDRVARAAVVVPTTPRPRAGREASR
jgi:excisionase family DNA binding protein